MSGQQQPSSATTKEFDYILESIVGGSGRWQWQKVLLLIPGWIATGGAGSLLIQMFSAYTPPHRCYVDGCDDQMELQEFKTEFLNFTVPKDDGGSNFLQ
jgi:hypothetical protein